MEIKLELTKQEVELLKAMISIHTSHDNYFKGVCEKIRKQLKEVK